MPAALRVPLVLDSSPAAALATGATDNTVLYTAARPFDVYDGHVLAIATAAVSGTAQIQRQALGAGGFSNLSTAMAMTTDGTITRVTTGMVTAQRVIAVTDVIRVQFVDGGGGGGANGHCYTKLLPNAITGAA